MELLRPLRALGFTRLILPVHHYLEVKQDVTGYVAALRAEGWLLTGWGWAEPVPFAADPATWSAYDVGRKAGEECVRHQLVRYIANAEDAYKWTGPSGKQDAGTPGRFAKSAQFIAGTRAAGYRGRISLCTYPGVDLDHKAWIAEKGPCYPETFRTGFPIAWGGIKASVDWCVSMGWPLARVKPLLSCFRGEDGQRADAQALIGGCREAATLGIGVYYAESGDLGDLPGWWAPFAGVIGPDPSAIAR